MKFHEFRSWYDIKRAEFGKLDRRQAYRKQMAGMNLAAGRYRQEDFVLLQNEAEWYENDRPYYKVYPCIVDALCRLKLDFNCERPDVPEGIISIRFAERHEPEARDGKKIAALLVHAINTRVPNGHKEQLLIQVTLLDDPDIRYWFYFDTNHPDKTIQEVLDSPNQLGDSMIPEYKEVSALATKIAITTCMLAHDPEIISPDVLVEDQTRYDKAGEEWKRKAEKRARKKHKFGWNLGRKLESVPHIRRPHLAIRHTGPKGSIPKVVKVRACTVHRDKLTKVPTGYMLPDGTEVEDGKAMATS